MKKLLAVLMIVTFLTGASRCTSSTSRAQELIEAYILERYGEGFEITQIKKEKFNPYGAWIVPYRWIATVTNPKTGVTFAAQYSNEDGNVTDQYAQTLYEKELDKKLTEVLGGNDAFYLAAEPKVRWLPTAADWEPTVTFEEAFRETSLIKLEAELRFLETGVEENAPRLREIFSALGAQRNEIVLRIRLISESGEPYCSFCEIPEEHQMETEKIREDLRALTDYARKEYFLCGTVDAFLSKQSFIQAGEYLSWNPYSGFTVELKAMDESGQGKAAALFSLYQTLSNEKVTGKMEISNSEGAFRRIVFGDGSTLEDFRQILLELDIQDG